VVYLILVPPVLLVSFLGICIADGSYTHGTRQANFLATPLPAAAPSEQH